MIAVGQKNKKPFLSNKALIVIISTTGILVYFLYYGVVQWGVAYAQCGWQKPLVKSSSFLSTSKTYTPNDVGYAPMSFASYSCIRK